MKPSRELVYGGQDFADDLDRIYENYAGDYSYQTFVEVLRDKLVSVLIESGDPDGLVWASTLAAL